MPYCLDMQNDFAFSLLASSLSIIPPLSAFGKAWVRVLVFQALQYSGDRPALHDDREEHDSTSRRQDQVAFVAMGQAERERHRNATTQPSPDQGDWQNGARSPRFAEG